MVDWFEDGWLVKLIASNQHSDKALEIAEQIDLPPAGGSPDEVELSAPSGMEIAARAIVSEEPGSYSLTIARCSSEDEYVPEAATLGVTLVEGRPSPQVFISALGQATRETIDGIEYWQSASRRQVVWFEGQAIMTVVSGEETDRLARFAASLRRTTRSDVEDWIEDAERHG